MTAHRPLFIGGRILSVQTLKAVMENICLHSIMKILQPKHCYLIQFTAYDCAEPMLIMITHRNYYFPHSLQVIQFTMEVIQKHHKQSVDIYS